MHDYNYLFVLLLLIVVAGAYKPVFLLHGFESNDMQMGDVARCIQLYHPGTLVINLPINNDVRSPRSMWEQTFTIGTIIKNYTKSSMSSQGYHFVGHSQGGLILRAILQTHPLDCDTMISMAGVQMGLYGFANLTPELKNLTLEGVTNVLYTADFQRNFSPANFWHHPNVTRYLQGNYYLPILEGLIYSNFSQVSDRKSNFLRLKKMVALGSPQDLAIVPWESSIFGYYNENLDVIPYRNQSIYLRDTYGLKSLDERGGLVVRSVLGVNHVQWLACESAVLPYVLPYLT